MGLLGEQEEGREHRVCQPLKANLAPTKCFCLWYSCDQHPGLHNHFLARSPTPVAKSRIP